MTQSREKMLDLLIKILPLAVTVVAVVAFAVRAESRIDATLAGQSAAERRFERVESAIASLQAASSANASTVANLVSLVARDQQDISRLNNIADASRSAVAEIKADVREIKAIVQRMETK